jgi:hypothetical protein
MCAKPRPGWKPPHAFPKGVASNPHGRPKGSKDRTPRNVWELLRSRGDRDALDILSEAASSNLVDMPLRIQAATALAGYQHGKRSALRWIEGITGLKAPTNVAEATAYVARIAQLMAEGRIDVDAGIALRDTLTAYISARTATDIEERLRHTEALVAELMLRNANTVSEVVGGLPVMPGCEQVRMPHLGPPVIDQAPTSNPWAPPADTAPPIETLKRGPGGPERRQSPSPANHLRDPKPDPERS